MTVARQQKENGEVTARMSGLKEWRVRYLAVGKEIVGGQSGVARASMFRFKLSVVHVGMCQVSTQQVI